MAHHTLTRRHYAPQHKEAPMEGVDWSCYFTDEQVEALTLGSGRVGKVGAVRDKALRNPGEVFFVEYVCNPNDPKSVSRSRAAARALVSSALDRNIGDLWDRLAVKYDGDWDVRAAQVEPGLIKVGVAFLRNRGRR
jgi:hypothetical protein